MVSLNLWLSEVLLSIQVFFSIDVNVAGSIASCAAKQFQLLLLLCQIEKTEKMAKLKHLPLQLGLTYILFL